MIRPHQLIPLLVVGALCALFEERCLTLGRAQSATCDEPAYLFAAYCDTHAGFPDTATGNCRLPFLLMGLGLQGTDCRLPQAIQKSQGLVFLAGPLMWDSMAAKDAQDALQRMRAVVTVISLLLALTVYGAGRYLWGTSGGIVALAAFTLNPVVITNSALATTDIIAAAFFTWYLLSLSYALRTRTWHGAVVAGIVGGLSLASKISGIIVVPVTLTVLCWLLVSARKPPAKRSISLVTAGLVCASVAFWWVYGFRYASGVPLDRDAFGYFFAPPRGLMKSVLSAAFTYHLLPERYLVDFMMVLSNMHHRHMYFMGEYSIDGWYRYFPLMWVIKTPVSLVILTGLGLGKAFRCLRDDQALLLLRVLVIGAIWYAGVALLSRVNIGVRHLLPIYPSLCAVAAAAVAYAKERGLFVRRVLVSGCLAALLVESLAAPDMSAYTSPLFGGTYAGYREITDSSYDWGGDLPAIRKWLEAHPVRSALYVDCVAISNIHRYGIDGLNLPLGNGQHYGAGTYIIGATRLMLGGESIAWGPWRPSYEVAYQNARTRASHSGQMDVKEVSLLEALERTRLLAYLRRNADVLRPMRAGPRVFVYDLTQQQVEAAFSGPPPYDRHDVVAGMDQFSDAELGFLR